MYNTFYVVIEYLKSFLLNDEDVNTVIHGVVNDIDIEGKKNIYPLSHIQVTGFFTETGTVTYNFTVHVLNQRFERKIAKTDKWLKNDNELDNINTTSGVILRLIKHLQLQRNDYDIELVNDPTPQIVQYEYMNTLDGFSVDIQLQVPTNISVCGVVTDEDRRIFEDTFDETFN